MKTADTAQLFARRTLNVTTPARMRRQLQPALRTLKLDAFITLRFTLSEDSDLLERDVERVVAVLTQYTRGAWVLEFIDFGEQRLQEAHLHALVALRSEESKEVFLEDLGLAIADAPVSFSMLNYEGTRGPEAYLNLIRYPCAVLNASTA
jgi:hypothetical protein